MNTLYLIILIQSKIKNFSKLKLVVLYVSDFIKSVSNGIQTNSKMKVIPRKKTFRLKLMETKIVLTIKLLYMLFFESFIVF